MGVSRTVGHTVVFHGKSDIGMVREENQDSFCIHSPEGREESLAKGLLLVVADGMGGLAGGATASRIAVETTDELYFGSAGEPEDLLVRGAREANRRILEETRRLHADQPMGSTLTTLALLEGYAVVAHIGDSRAYRFSRDEGLRQITRDHTLVQELADRGEIEPDSLPYLLHRNVLTRGLGLQDEVEVDLVEIADLKAGESFLLCSDGLYDVVDDSEIESRLIAHGGNQSELVDDLIELARSRGAPDNVTVLVARLDPVDDSRRGVEGQAEAALEGPADRGERRALGFLPQSIFVPLTYFLTFALGVLLTLNFQDTSSSESPTSLEAGLRQILEEPRLDEFAGENAALELRSDLERFLRWLEERDASRED